MLLSNRSDVRGLARLRLALTCVLLALLALLAVPQPALAEEKLVNGSGEDVVKPGQPLKPDPAKVTSETEDVEPKQPPQALAKPIDGAVAIHSTAVSAQAEVYEANREVLRLKGQGLDTTAADQRLADARARLEAAIPQDIAADQAVNDRIADATKQATLERYGDGGPSLVDRATDGLKSAAGRTGGFAKGLLEGAGKALTDMASTVMHPLATWDAITKEANLTSEERASRLAAEDRASLTTKATESIREVDDPAGVGFAKGERAGTAVGEALTSAGVSMAAGPAAGRLVSAGAARIGGAARLAGAVEEAGAGAAALAKPNVRPLEGAPKAEPIAKPPGELPGEPPAEPLSNAPSEELCVEGGCFAGGTEIATALGGRAIEDVRAGDEVLARDPETGETRFEHVARTFVHPSEVVDLTLEDEAGRREHITATPEHPFHVADGSFRPVSELSLGDVVDTATGIARVVSLESLRDPVTVYNFEVENAHTYFVGETKAWVHNCSRANLGRQAKPEPVVRLGEGSFSVGYRQGNLVWKYIKPTVPSSQGGQVALDAVSRERLALTTVYLTNAVSDALGGQFVPKMVNAGNGVMRQPLAQGLTVQQLAATDRYAYANAQVQMTTLTSRAARRVGLRTPTEPLLSTPDGWKAYIDSNPANFRFDRQGRILTWFDPIAVFPSGPRALFR